VTTNFIRRHASVSVGRRLFVGLLPALLAVLVTAGLAYYGEYGRAVPGIILATASVLSIVSLVVTWINTRYLSARINRLTGAMPESEAERHGASDEFDRIERVVDHLGSEPGFLGPLGPRKPIRVIADRSVDAMGDFVIGANERGYHLAGVNWGRDLPEPDLVADSPLHRRRDRDAWA